MFYPAAPTDTDRRTTAGSTPGRERMEQDPVTVDLLIIGSGAGGMSAAIRAHDLGLRALVVESSDKYGGSTAMSGGVCWVANNPHMKKRGIDDSHDEGLAYLKAITRGEIEESRLANYMTESLRMMTWLEERTHVRFDALDKYTDYYPEEPGGKPGGRSMECPEFNGALLGDEFRALRRPHPQSQIFGLFGITARQAHTFLSSRLRTFIAMFFMFIGYMLRSGARRRLGRDTKLCAGNSLIARLRRSMMDRNIPLWLNSPANELIIEDGRVVGARVSRDGKVVDVRAERGVVLAAGGFDRNLEMRQRYQPSPITTDWTAANPANLGRGIEMGMEAGGAVALMDEAWWTPTCLIPGQKLASVLVVEKSLPHSCFVNQHGHRFTNEAAPYIDVVHGMYADQQRTNATIPAWMVFDATCRERYPVGPVAPGYAMKDNRLPRRIREEFLFKANTIEELAAKMEVEPATLRATVDRFNGFAREGHDPDFHRGESASDRYYGDPRSKPNPCLGPIESGPFYAIRVYPGDLGTKGGLVTDLRGRVEREDGSVIDGLFAVGNCQASVMGRTYPGAGGTIGPALTFGMLAAEAAAEAATATADAAE